MTTRQHDDKIATKRDVKDAQEELATMMAKSFANVATKDDLKALATKEDLKDFATKNDLKQIRKEIATKEDLARLEGSQAAILDVVKSIDHQLKEHSTHPTRLARLERSIFHS